MRIFLLLPVSLLLAAAQQAPSKKQSVIIAAPQPMKPPPVTLQRALQIAERYIAENKIEMQRYWLQEAKWVLPQGVHAWKGSHWFFHWNTLQATLGDYVEIRSRHGR